MFVPHSVAPVPRKWEERCTANHHPPPPRPARMGLPPGSGELGQRQHPGGPGLREIGRGKRAAGVP